jgi:hypothetical protein
VPAIAGGQRLDGVAQHVVDVWGEDQIPCHGVVFGFSGSVDRRAAEEVRCLDLLANLSGRFQDPPFDLPVGQS